jgi:hypothetical protein
MCCVLFVYYGYTQMESPWERMPPDVAGEVNGTLEVGQGSVSGVP